MGPAVLKKSEHTDRDRAVVFTMLYCTGHSHSLTHVTGGKTEAPEGSLDSLALVPHIVAAVTWISPQMPGSTCSPVTSQSLGAWSAEGAGFRIPGRRASMPSLPVAHPSLGRLGQPPLSH